MIRMFWMQATVALLVAAGTAHAQINTDPFPLLTKPEAEAFVAAQNVRAQQIYLLQRDAEKAIQKGDLVRAAPLLQQALQVEPNDADCRDLLADIYIQWNRPNDVLQTLRPRVYYSGRDMFNIGLDEVTAMKYVLALLDTGKWTEATTIYEQVIQQKQKNNKGKNLTWDMLSYRINFNLKEHTLPDAHFSPDIPDEPGLRAQAHLILGSRLPLHVDPNINKRKHIEYMLDHLQQALKSDRRCLDAQFLSGVLLGTLERFAEARAAFAKAALLAPREAQPEIRDALAKMKEYEASKKLYDAQHPAESSQTKPGR